MAIGYPSSIKLAMVFLVIAILATAVTGIVAAESRTNHAKTQVLAYIVGSDLETNDAMASDDLKEIAGSIEGSDPSKLDIVVAFGGAKKDGWRGMRIATGDQLKRDAKDGVFGNGEYLYTDPGADMGSGATLLKFIQEVKSARTSDRTILIIADHGNSYDGIGNDDITGNQLKMADIDSALRGSGIRYDPIMFDACLMASVEVGKTVQPYTGVMLGSEEIQRGSYNYAAIIEPLMANPDTDANVVMKGVGDAYIDRDGTSKSSGKVKTMAIIDVSKIPAIRESLDELGAKLVPVAETDQGLHDLKSAYNDAVRLGVTGGGKPTSVDLVSLLQNIESRRPDLAPEIQKTIGVVRSAVLYERHNAYSPAVYGISIASPDAMNMATYTSYGDAVRIGPRWDAFFQKMIEVSQKEGYDSSAPAKSVTAGSYSGSASGAVADSDEDKVKKDLDKKTASLGTLRFIAKGNGTYALMDPYHDASVYATYYRINGSRALEIGAVPVRPGPDGRYTIPAWDGRWYYIPADPAPATVWDRIHGMFTGRLVTSQPFFVDLVYEDRTSGGYDKYSSWVSILENGESTDAMLTTYVNSTEGRVEMSIDPYTTTNDGGELFNRGMDHFEKGSRVTSYTLGYDLQTKASSESLLSRTTASPEMTVKYAMLPDGTYAAGLQAYYDEDNEVLADQFRILNIRNGAITSSVIGTSA